MTDRPKSPGEQASGSPQVPDAWRETVSPDLFGGETVRPTNRADAPGGPQPLAMPTATITRRSGEPVPGASAPPAAPAGGEALKPEPLPGPLFEVIKEIGRGGMGVVYAAEQGSLRRQIALKMISAPEHQRARLERQFVAEAMVTGDLDHPNIVPIHDLGRDAEGNLFMAMKLVRGRSWDALLRERPVEGESARTRLREHLEILVRVCDAVGFAHSRQIVHRDLKPENVMVGEFGEVLVMDWGIALDVSQPRSGEAKAEHRETASPCAGTPRYMAPEVARAEGAAVGPWTDVYLLGAILYEILTGSPPHRGANVYEVLGAAARGEVEPPEERAPGRRVPRELGRIALTALAADPTSRFADAGQLQRALRDYLAHEESLRLADEAHALLEDLGKPGAVGVEERYGAWTRALSRFAEALDLWPGNAEARRGRALAAMGLADEALDRGDSGLAAAQLPLLREGPAVDSSRLQAIEAGVARRSKARWKVWTGALATAAAALLGYQAAAHQIAESVKAEEKRAARRQSGREADEAWGHVRRGARAELEAALGKPSVQAARSPLPLQPADGLRWALQVMLWAEGRSAELAESLEMGASPVREQALRRLASRPEVAETPFGRRLAASLATKRQVRPWRMAAEEASAGIDPAALRAVVEELGSDAVAGTSPLAAARNALHSAALVELAWEAAVSAGDVERATGHAAARVPFLLTEAPFGPPVGVAAPAPRIVFEPEALVALDPQSGVVRWRRPIRQDDRPNRVVPVIDGSVVAVSRGEVIRLAGETGAVLGRVLTGEQGQLAWPDPLDRSRLVVLLGLEGNQGWGELLPIKSGRAETTVFFTSILGEIGWTTDFPSAASKELTDELSKRPDAPKGPQRDAWIAEQRSRALEALAPLDPANPGLWIRALEDAPAAEADRRNRLAAKVLETAADTAMVAGIMGARLERQGFRAEADLLYGAAARAFHAQAPNPGLAIGLLSTPSLHLRRLGGERFAEDPERALQLVELGRRFNSYAEGDNRFYHRYVRWLELKGRQAEAAAMQARVAESQGPGGTFLLPARYLVAVDVAMALLLASPLLALLLIARMWWRAGPTRRADLHSLGFRTRLQRNLAFLTSPPTRIAFTCFRYAGRFQRALLAALCLTFLASAALVSRRVTDIGRMAASPVFLSAGVPGHSGLRGMLLEALEDRSPSASVLRLLAESSRALGDHADAKARCEQVLKLEPQDPVCLNNLGVLAERAGDRSGAGELYRRAVAAGGAAAQVNLARMAGDMEGAAQAARKLAHADALALEFQSAGTPHWARASYSDLEVAMDVSQPVWKEAFGGVFGMLTRNFRDIGGIFDVARNVDGESEVIPPGVVMGSWTGYLALGLLLLGLAWLPFPVRPLVRATRGSPTPKRRWLAWAREAVAVPGLALPGAWDLLFGRPALGAAMLMALAWGWAVRFTVQQGGVLGAIAIPEFNRGYFPEVGETLVYPELQALALAAGALIGAVYLVNLARAAMRARALLAQRKAPAKGPGT